MRGGPRTKARLFIVVLIGIAAYALYQYPPLTTVGPGELGVRVNRLTGDITQWRDGSVFAFPGIYEMRVHSLRDRTYQPNAIKSVSGPAPLQSIEGLSLGVDMSVRYALDPARLSAISRELPDDIGTEIVEPVVAGVIYKTFAR